MARAFRVPLAALLVLSGGCLGTEEANSRTLNFLFAQQNGLATGWTLGVADLPADRAAEVAADGGERTLPAELNTTATSLYQSGTNVAGDLFLFQKKYLAGLPPNQKYHVSLQAGFVTNYHSGCSSGVGSSVVLKAGVSSTEPIAAPDAQGILRMNVDKGAGTSAGDFATLGDIRNGLAGCPATGNYALNGTSSVRQSVDVTSDAAGGLWFFLATQSSASGQRHAIYITQLVVKLTF